MYTNSYVVEVGPLVFTCYMLWQGQDNKILGFGYTVDSPDNPYNCFIRIKW